MDIVNYEDTHKIFTEKLDIDFIINSKGLYALIAIVDKIHFNPNYPQLRSITLNKSHSYNLEDYKACVKTNNEWVTIDAKTFFKKVVDDYEMRYFSQSNSYKNYLNTVNKMDKDREKIVNYLVRYCANIEK